MTTGQRPGRVEHTGANGPGKRLIDLILAGAALLVIWPVLAVLGLERHRATLAVHLVDPHDLGKRIVEQGRRVGRRERAEQRDRA